jgi:hypothetical protein
VLLLDFLRIMPGPWSSTTRYQRMLRRSGSENYQIPSLAMVALVGAEATTNRNDVGRPMCEEPLSRLILAGTTAAPPPINYHQ